MKEYRQKICVAKLGAFLAALCFIVGCEHRRVIAIAKVQDVDSVVTTKNRYKLVALKVEPQGENYEVTSANVTAQKADELNEELKIAMPHVFADDGIPFTLRAIPLPREESYGWTLTFLYAMSLLTLPMCESVEYRFRYVLDVVDMPDAHAKFEQSRRRDNAGAMFTPSPLLFYIGDYGTPEGYEGCRKFSSHSICFMTSPIIGDVYDSHSENEALAYGIAVKLKRMEDDGVINLSKHQVKVQRQEKDEIAIGNNVELVDFKREAGYEHRYVFALNVHGGSVTLQESRRIQDTLRTMIRDDFISSFPSVKQDLLIIDFTQYVFAEGRITGRVSVLTLRVVSLDYDPNSRKGTIGIRIGENQYEDARMYARKNIEALVRDKNIALVAGKIPPSARFYLLDETMRDNILRIEFRTE